MYLFIYNKMFYQQLALSSPITNDLCLYTHVPMFQLVRLDSEFMHIMFLVFFSLIIWPLVYAISTLNSRDPKLQAPFDLISPSEFPFCPFSECTCGLQSHGKAICVTHEFMKLHWSACIQKGRRKTYQCHDQQILPSLRLKSLWQKRRKCHPYMCHC